MLKWYYPEKGELPEDYCQCLVKLFGCYRILWFNDLHECWDDEKSDDYLCDPTDVTKWTYLKNVVDEFEKEPKEGEGT